MLRFLAVAAVAVLMAAIPAYAQSDEQVTLESNKSQYVQGDDIIIFGSVQRVAAGSITIQIFAPDETLIDVAQPDVALDGSFVHTVRTGGERWEAQGIYLMKASYGDVEVEETFILSKATVDPVEQSDCTRSVDGGPLGNVEVGCSITGGSLIGMQVDQSILGLELEIVPTSAGTIRLVLPTELIDAQDAQGANTDYIVRIDDIQVSHNEVAFDSISRTIEIGFSEGESTIEVIGTMVVPEFGAVAMIVLASGVAAAFALRRTGLSFPAR